MRLFSALAQKAQALFLKSFIYFIRVMPYRAAIKTGRFFGMMAWICIPLHRKISRIQMQSALGSGDERKLTRRVFMNQGDIVVDMIKFAYMSADELKERVIIDGRENLAMAAASGRGVMMITGHMNWEILGHLPRLTGTEFCIMGDVIKNDAIQSVIEDMRSRCGFTLLPPKGGMVSMLTGELKQGRIIGIVIDQRGKRESKLFCDFFGMPAPTNPAPAFIALKGDALIQPVSAIKEGDKYRFSFEKPIDTREFGDDFKAIDKLHDCWKSEAVQKASDAMQTWLCSVVRKNPDQWFWLHSRWLRRSDMKHVLKSGKDFKEHVMVQADSYLKQG